ncbi:hypothetical protein DFH91_000685 [Clostridium saccharobutylicum]|uniref:hypothetical protein n=1 Tax=Clostridium saccharobutylicum TaxID=169679 RepID=UPI00149492E1|nr:hypothetical protein [Clostridium saccharobutylicum]NOV83195.1 hypothetical protein [Clostridium saccharobutylicum]
MDEELQKYLECLKKYTVQMIFALKNDNIDDFEINLNKRTQTINEIRSFDFEKSEFKKKCEELDIISINNELSKITNEKREEVKVKILELKKLKMLIMHIKQILM